MRRELFANCDYARNPHEFIFHSRLGNWSCVSVIVGMICARMSRVYLLRTRWQKYRNCDETRKRRTWKLLLSHNTDAQWSVLTAPICVTHLVIILSRTIISWRQRRFLMILTTRESPRVRQLEIAISEQISSLQVLIHSRALRVLVSTISPVTKKLTIFRDGVFVTR